MKAYVSQLEIPSTFGAQRLLRGCGDPRTQEMNFLGGNCHHSQSFPVRSEGREALSHRPTLWTRYLQP